MKRVYNFSAGPSALPLEVLQEVQRDMLDYADTGMSITEMTTAPRLLKQSTTEIEASLRELLNVPDNYYILFVQGGASQQVCRSSSEPARQKQQSRLCADGQFLHQILRRGLPLRRHTRRGKQQGRKLHLYSPQVRYTPRRAVSPYLHEQYYFRARATTFCPKPTFP